MTMGQNEPGGDGRLVDVKEAARFLGISPWTIRRLIDSGTLPCVRLPNGGSSAVRRLLIDRDDLEKLVRAAKEQEQP